MAWIFSGELVETRNFQQVPKVWVRSGKKNYFHGLTELLIRYLCSQCFASSFCVHVMQELFSVRRDEIIFLLRQYLIVHAKSSSKNNSCTKLDQNEMRQVYISRSFYSTYIEMNYLFPYVCNSDGIGFSKVWIWVLEVGPLSNNGSRTS